MRIKVDQLGRVQLPKKILQFCGLAPGSFLEVDVEKDVVRLRPAAERSWLVERSGVLVFEGVAPESISEAVRKLRKTRNSHIGGASRPSGRK